MTDEQKMLEAMKALQTHPDPKKACLGDQLLDAYQRQAFDAGHWLDHLPNGCAVLKVPGGWTLGRFDAFDAWEVVATEPTLARLASAVAKKGWL